MFLRGMDVAGMAIAGCCGCHRDLAVLLVVEVVVVAVVAAAAGCGCC
jgi:hypothetical protein